MQIHRLIRAARILTALIAMLWVLIPSTPIRAAESAEPEASDTFIKVAPLNISIIKDYRVRGMLQVEIGLDVPDNELHDRAVYLYPRLQDAYVLALRFYAGNQLRLYKLPNVDQIARVLQSVTDDVLKEKGAKVLLSQVMLHRP